MSTTFIGAKDNTAAKPWSENIFSAFVSGASQLFWTEKTLYWISKPTLSVEKTAFGRRLHCETGPACANDVENLYFIHGQLLPAYAVIRPEWITVAEIHAEANNDTRSILIDRMGWVKYLNESGAKKVDHRKHPREGTPEELYEDASGLRRLVVIDPATAKRVALGVPREIATCRDAQLWLSHNSDELAMCRT